MYMPQQLYIIEARAPDGTLDLREPQAVQTFGLPSISGMTADAMAQVIFRRLPDAILRGDAVGLWPSLLDARWIARRKFWVRGATMPSEDLARAKRSLESGRDLTFAASDTERNILRSHGGAVHGQLAEGGLLRHSVCACRQWSTKVTSRFPSAALCCISSRLRPVSSCTRASASGDTYAAYKLLESFVAEIERLSLPDICCPEV